VSTQRCLLIGAVSLIKGRVREAGMAMVEVADRIEPVLNETGYMASAPFKTVHLIIRFGEKTDLDPKLSPINRREMELPAAVELEMAPLRLATRDVVARAIMDATVAVLLNVAEKYNLPKDRLGELKSH
jgi:hypothetical protein